MTCRWPRTPKECGKCVHDISRTVSVAATNPDNPDKEQWRCLEEQASSRVFPRSLVIPFVLTVLLLLFEAGLLLKHKLLSMPLQFSLKSCLLHLKFLLIQFQHQHFTPNSNKSLCLVCTILAPNITKLGKRDKEKIQEVTNFG